MPKGGELHYHLAGSAYPETMLGVAEKRPYCLDVDNLSIKTAGLCKDDYLSTTLPHQPNLYGKYVEAWSMKNFVPGAQSAHDHFFAAFEKFMPIVNNHRPELLTSIVRRAANQNEQYLEIMAIPDNGNSLTFANILQDKKTFAEKLKALKSDKAFEKNIQATIASAKQIQQQTKKLLKCDETPQSKACHVTVKFQYYLLRELPIDNVFAMAVNAFEVAKRSDDFVGLNLVQPEDSQASLKNYEQQMKMMQFLHAQYPKVNIALHAGELTPNVVIPQELRYHINDAVKIGQAQRIGHGVDIAYENNADDLVRLMAKKGIAVEVNLTSNQWILGIKGKQHPLRYYLANHVPVVLSTDDEGILRTDLTTQYVKAAFEHGLNYQDLKNITRNALSYSFLPGKSLWQDNMTYKPVDECTNFDSKKCHNYLLNSEKARLQLQLEKKLSHFETKY